MRLVSKHLKNNRYYEKLILSYRHENGKVISVFSYEDTENQYSYTSQLFEKSNEWSAVKIAVIYAEKYLKENNIKDCFCKNIWEQFFSSKQPILEGI